MRRLGLALIAAIAVATVAAPWIAPHDPRTQHRAYVLAPPMPVRVIDDGRLHPPFAYPLRLVDALSRTYEEDRDRRTPVLRRTATQDTDTIGRAVTDPWFPLGTDALGRDIWSRLLLGARLSLGVALLACAGALAGGGLIGGWAAARGGLLDEIVMRATELVLVLPVVYVVVVLRAVLPLTVEPLTLFGMLAGVLAVAGTPQVARGVHAIVASEATRDYVAAARVAGASERRILVRHLLPATTSYLGTQALLLFPAFVLAEATLSFVGLGFAPPAASWGTMLQDAANVRAIVDTPWILSPAVALALVVFALNLVLDDLGATVPAPLGGPQAAPVESHSRERRPGELGAT